MAAYSTTEPPSQNKSGKMMTAYERNDLRYPCENLAWHMEMTQEKISKLSGGNRKHLTKRASPEGQASKSEKVAATG